MNSQRRRGGVSMEFDMGMGGGGGGGGHRRRGPPPRRRGGFNSGPSNNGFGPPGSQPEAVRESRGGVAMSFGTDDMKEDDGFGGGGGFGGPPKKGPPKNLLNRLKRKQRKGRKKSRGKSKYSANGSFKPKTRSKLQQKRDAMKRRKMGQSQQRGMGGMNDDDYGFGNGRMNSGGFGNNNNNNNFGGDDTFFGGNSYQTPERPHGNRQTNQQRRWKVCNSPSVRTFEKQSPRNILRGYLNPMGNGPFRSNRPDPFGRDPNRRPTFDRMLMTPSPQHFSSSSGRGDVQAVPFPELNVFEDQRSNRPNRPPNNQRMRRPRPGPPPNQNSRRGGPPPPIRGGPGNFRPPIRPPSKRVVLTNGLKNSVENTMDPAMRQFFERRMKVRKLVRKRIRDLKLKRVIPRVFHDERRPSNQRWTEGVLLKSPTIRHVLYGKRKKTVLSRVIEKKGKKK